MSRLRLDEVMRKYFIVILSLMVFLVCILLYRLSSPNDKVLLESINKDLSTIVNAVNRYYEKFGSFPETADGIEKLVEVKLLAKPPVSPWGYQYFYLLSENGNHVTIISYGRDNKIGGNGLDKDVSQSINRAKKLDTH